MNDKIHEIYHLGIDKRLMFADELIDYLNEIKNDLNSDYFTIIDGQYITGFMDAEILLDELLDDIKRSVNNETINN